MEQKSLQRRARDIVRPAHVHKPYAIKTHIILFTEKDSMASNYVMCFEEQVNLLFEFLKENNAELITVIRLGRTEMVYDATLKQ